MQSRIIAIAFMIMTVYFVFISIIVTFVTPLQRYVFLEDMTNVTSDDKRRTKF